MGNGAIADEQITASSEWDGYHAAVQGRLHFPEAGGKAGGWAARTRDTKQWLQIDLENKCSNITRVATQGRNGANEWVTEYLLQYSYDGVGFYYYGDQKQIPKKVKKSNRSLFVCLFVCLFFAVVFSHVCYNNISKQGFRVVPHFQALSR